MELLDSRGCLTEAGLRLVAQATPGQAPRDLAAHVAACGPCQRRLLSADRPAGARVQRGVAWPAVTRAITLLLVVVAVGMVLLVVARHLLVP